jgi:hypothetical protein
MNARTKLNQALSYLEKARQHLTTALNSPANSPHYTRLAQREIEDAVSQINDSLKCMPKDLVRI